MRCLVVASLILLVAAGASAQSDSAEFNWLWITSPRTNEDLSGKNSVKIGWDSNLPEDTRYAVVYGRDEKHFDEQIASGLRERECQWDLRGRDELFGWIKVKAYGAHGMLIAEDMVSVSFVPQTGVVVSKANQRVFHFEEGELKHVFICSTALPQYDLSPGRYKVYYRSRNHHSREYDVDMPNALFFFRGYALHATRVISRLGRPASHGCIRLHPRDARTLFDEVEVGTPVIVLPHSRDCSVLLDRYEREKDSQQRQVMTARR